MDIPAQFLGRSLDQWQAIGSLATALALIVATGTGVVALLQLRQSRHATESAQDQANKAALDQSRPYVLLTIETSPASSQSMDLVISNVGVGPVFDVSIKVDPPLSRAEESPGYELKDARIFREPIAMLPPHYRLATWFDTAAERSTRTDLPTEFTVRVGYNDGRGHVWNEQSTLDVNIPHGLLFTETYNIHHVAKELKEISKVLRTSKTLKSPLEVLVEDRDTYVQRTTAMREKQPAQREDLVERMLPGRRETGGATEGGSPVTDAKITVWAGARGVVV